MTARPAVLLGARGVTVERRHRAVLVDVDLEVHAGELVALVGPNGAGKSTLLGALCGDVAVAAGEVTLLGEPVARWSAGDQARTRAVLPQRHAVAFGFTVAEVVAMGRAPWRGTAAAAEDDAAVRDAMATTDVAHLAHRTVSTLSGGEPEQVALARVLAQRCPVLLLDEPTAALDLRHTELVLDAARTRRAAGDAVVVVLHDLTLAGAHADRVVVLDEGRIVADGSPADVLTPTLLGAVYRHAVEVLPHPSTARPVVLAARPHDVPTTAVRPDSSGCASTPILELQEHPR
ncbi:MAG: heme ABC transporter ATP-binding protein [Acidimicrobiales bacterium]